MDKIFSIGLIVIIVVMIGQYILIGICISIVIGMVIIILSNKYRMISHKNESILEFNHNHNTDNALTDKGTYIGKNQGNDEPVSSVSESESNGIPKSISKIMTDVSSYDVPYWEHMYIYSVDDLQSANQTQKRFYEHFKTQFIKKHYLDIADNSNYAFVLMFDLANDYRIHKDYDLLKRQLETLANEYPVVAKYINRTISKIVLIVQQEDAECELRSYSKTQEQICRWITPDESIDVQGIKLTRGNFYIGECFLLPNSILRNNGIYSQERTHIFGSVLNTQLPASNAEKFNSSFCSYYNMSPAWRYEYLMWLSGDKQASDIHVDVLLFYLYGCEIRMFIDQRTLKSERRYMLSEMIKLYKSIDSKSSHHSIWELQQKLSEFIGCSIVKYFPDELEMFDTKGILENCSAYTDCLIIHKIKNKNSFSPEDIYNIANELYNIDRIIPKQYISSARHNFINAFMKLYPNPNFEISELNQSICNYHVCYYHNTGCFNSEKIDFYHSFETPIATHEFWIFKDAIRKAYGHIESKFRRYKQEIGRNNGEETIMAIQFLPEDIDVNSIIKLHQFINNIERDFQHDNYLSKPIDWLLDSWGYVRKDEKSLHKEYVDTIIGGLHRLGYGIVPNYQIDKKRFNFGELCIIYKKKDYIPIELDVNYEKSELFIKLASIIVHADKVIDDDFAVVEQQLSYFGNTSGNYLHLLAVARWRFLSKKQSIDTSTKNAIASLPIEQRKLIGNSLIQLSCINGNISPKRVECLKKILPLIGIVADNIHSHIHRLLTDNEGFATVEKKSDASEFSIIESVTPRQSYTSNIGISLEKLRILEQQTKDAQELLSSIFDEDDIGKSNNSTLESINTWHGILELLLTKEKWKRSEIKSICDEQGLMLGATLEQINDFAYAKVEDAIIEDDGEYIYVTLEYKDQLI